MDRHSSSHRGMENQAFRIANVYTRTHAAGASQQCPIDLTDDEPAPRAPMPAAKQRNVSNNAMEALLNPPQTQSTPARKRKAPSSDSSPPKEKRLRAFRPRASAAFANVYERALSQRFYVLQRTQGGTTECPEEAFEMTGSTGNIYNVCIKQQPTCDCPHALKGNQCKHVIYVRTSITVLGEKLTVQEYDG